ncbi:GPW/gp25 family protein [Actinomadura namibiensis]
MRIDSRGHTALADDEQYLRGLIEHVLLTRLGERVNRPTFGSGVSGLVFTAPGDELANGVQALVHGAIQQWLGDLLQVEDVRVEGDEGTLQITVVYQPASTAAVGGRRTARVVVAGTP